MPDVSLNAVANLGYAECRFHRPVVPGDTLRTSSEVIGLKQNSNGKTGVVYVRSTATNQRGEVALDWVRWVMVHKRDADARRPRRWCPSWPSAVAAEDLIVPAGPRLHRLRLRRGGRAAPLGRLRRSARRSTTSTASRSPMPST